MGREAKVMGRLEEANGIARVAGTRWVYGCFLDPNRTSPFWEGVCDREGAETRHCLGARVGVEDRSAPSACPPAPVGQPLCKVQKVMRREQECGKGPRWVRAGAVSSLPSSAPATEE